MLNLLVAAAALVAPAISAGQSIREDVPLLEVTAFVQARTAFERNCFRCHKEGGEQATRKSLDRLDMSRYPFAGRYGPVAGRAIRRALGGAGVTATMPKDNPEGLGADDLAAILKWANAFDVLHPAKN